MLLAVDKVGSGGDFVCYRVKKQNSGGTNQMSEIQQNLGITILFFEHIEA